jgi:ubiquinone/menaquinone biosynthesis C-methylase UbiE
MDKETIDTYNKMAKEYDNETADFWDKFPISFIDKFKNSVVKNGKVLNVGSGPGRDGLILSKKGLDIVCLDASETMVKMCLEKGLNAITGDLMSLPFDDKEFDAVWAYTSLLHVSKKDIIRAISEIYRVLKKDSIFALGMIEGDKEEYRTSSGVDKPRLFAFYTKEEIEKLLKNAGFETFYFEQFAPRSKNYLNYLSRKI